MKKLEKQINGFVGGKIKSIRMEAGLTQRKLGKEVGVAPQQIQKYEKGLNTLSASKLFILSKGFNVPVQYFFPQDDHTTIEPKTVQIIRLLNHIPAEHYDDVSNIINIILRITCKYQDNAIKSRQYE